MYVINFMMCYDYSQVASINKNFNYGIIKKNQVLEKYETLWQKEIILPTTTEFERKVCRVLRNLC